MFVDKLENIDANRNLLLSFHDDVNKVLRNYLVKMPQTFRTKRQKDDILTKAKRNFFTARSPSNRNLCKGKTGCDGLFQCKRDNARRNLLN